LTTTDTEHSHRIALSVEVGQTINTEIERRYQACQAARTKA